MPVFDILYGMDANGYNELRLGNYLICPGTNEVRVKSTWGREKLLGRLTPKEMGVLILLLSNQNQTVTRNRILENVWGDQFGNNLGLTQAISKLRKLFAGDKRVEIRTIPKIGYLFVYQGSASIGRPGKRIIKRYTSVVAIASIALIIGILIIAIPIRVTVTVEDAPTVSDKVEEKSSLPMED